MTVVRPMIPLGPGIQVVVPRGRYSTVYVGLPEWPAALDAVHERLTCNDPGFAVGIGLPTLPSGVAVTVLDVGPVPSVLVAGTVQS